MLALRGEDVKFLNFVFCLCELFLEASDLSLTALTLVLKILDRLLVLSACILHVSLQLSDKLIQAVHFLFVV